jgi:hypothetical protein
MFQLANSCCHVVTACKVVMICNLRRYCVYYLRYLMIKFTLSELNMLYRASSMNMIILQSVFTDDFSLYNLYSIEYLDDWMMKCVPGSSVSIVSWLRTGRPGDRGSIPGRGERIFPVASVSRPALGPTQPPVQWVPGVLSPGLKRGRGVTLTTHPI